MRYHHPRDFLVLKQGEYNKRPILCKFCPFCGVVIYKPDKPKVDADAKQ